MSGESIQFGLAKLEQIIDLRWRILRAGLPRETAIFDGDQLKTTLHFAGQLNGGVIACVSFLVSTWDDQPAWQLRGMAVDAPFQHQGIGSQILRYSVGEAMKVAARAMWCNARISAMDFYSSHGWQVVGERFDIPSAGPHYRMIRSS